MPPRLLFHLLNCQASLAVSYYPRYLLTWNLTNPEIHSFPFWYPPGQKEVAKKNPDYNIVTKFNAFRFVPANLCKYENVSILHSYQNYPFLTHPRKSMNQNNNQIKQKIPLQLWVCQNKNKDLFNKQEAFKIKIWSFQTSISFSPLPTANTQ